ncbi:MAG: hypothetical protein HOA28_05395 [Euryarchaeota archaeon]|nr:hypothetical protein [Euryarchaeota archaeon]
MADNLTREETNEILLKVYSDNLEDTEKIKKISNIPKLLDKFDGKYDKLVEALHKKYTNISKESTSDDSFNDFQPVEKGSPKKETPIFPDDIQEPDEPDVMEEPDEPDVMEEPDEPDVMEEPDEPDGPDVMEEPDEPDEPVVMEELEEELSRSRVSVLMEESYRQNLDDPDKKIAGIPKMLDKFEGRYEKLMDAMSKKYPLRDYSIEKDTHKSFEDLINSIRNNDKNRESWIDLSKYFDSVGKLGRSLECSNHSENL